MANRKSKKLSKQKFCKHAKTIGSKRNKFLRMVHKKTTKAHKIRVKHLKSYCKTHKNRSDRAFCRKALKFSGKRVKNDRRYVRLGLKRNSKRHRDLVRYCKH